MKWSTIGSLLLLVFTVLQAPVLTHGIEAGLVYGPIANEEVLLQEIFHEPLYFYDFPVFIGGAYFRTDIQENLVFHTDILASVHPVNMGADRVDALIGYHHQEVRRVFPGTVRPFLGTGLELLWIHRNYAHDHQYNFYNSIHVYPIVSTGVSVQLGKIRVGSALRARVGGYSDSLLSGRGQMTLHAGWAFR